MGTQFLLFDIDGVLIQPKGYRKAVFDTTNFFLQQLGIPDKNISEEIITTFESVGITSEWDMIPLFLISLIESAFLQREPGSSITEIMDLKNYFQSYEFQYDPEAIITFIEKIHKFKQDGYSACELVFNKIFKEQSNEILSLTKKHAEWLLIEWIGESRNIRKSSLLQFFQNLTLGSDVFEKITGMTPFVFTDPYLVKFDQPLIQEKYKNELVRLTSSKNFFSVAITARPSLYPATKNHKNFGLNFPEAELALQCLKLEEFPCVGFGAMEYLGLQKKSSGEHFVKPAPMHALVAILTASGMDVEEALNLSHEYIFTKRTDEVINYFSNFIKPIQACIFEDSIIGIQSLNRICELLRNDGIYISSKAYGIAKELNKINALKKENAIIYPTINEAFSSCVDDSIN